MKASGRIKALLEQSMAYANSKKPAVSLSQYNINDDNSRRLATSLLNDINVAEISRTYLCQACMSPTEDISLGELESSVEDLEASIARNEAILEVVCLADSYGLPLKDLADKSIEVKIDELLSLSEERIVNLRAERAAQTANIRELVHKTFKLPALNNEIKELTSTIASLNEELFRLEADFAGMKTLYDAEKRKISKLLKTRKRKAEIKEKTSEIDTLKTRITANVQQKTMLMKRRDAIVRLYKSELHRTISQSVNMQEIQAETRKQIDLRKRLVRVKSTFFAKKGIGGRIF